MFVYGDDADAKKVVTGLVAELGFEPATLGRSPRRATSSPLRCSGSAWLWAWAGSKI
jgi:predicted dinucleotide-binding enzyme